jgi:transketolase C-terminal domain/subunit
LAEALEAARRLRAVGVAAGVISAPLLKPFDRAGFLRVAAQTPLIISVEEHCGVGGLGALCAEALAEERPGARLLRRFAPEGLETLGSQPWMRAACGLDAAALAAAAQAALPREAPVKSAA